MTVAFLPVGWLTCDQLFKKKNHKTHLPDVFFLLHIILVSNFNGSIILYNTYIILYITFWISCNFNNNDEVVFVMSWNYFNLYLGAFII